MLFQNLRLGQGAYGNGLEISSGPGEPVDDERGDQETICVQLSAVGGDLGMGSNLEHVNKVRRQRWGPPCLCGDHAAKEVPTVGRKHREDLASGETRSAGPKKL